MRCEISAGDLWRATEQALWPVGLTRRSDSSCLPVSLVLWVEVGILVELPEEVS
jgi:hypothetical protein